MGSQRGTGVLQTRTGVSVYHRHRFSRPKGNTRAILNKLALGCDKRRRIASLRADKPKKKSVKKSLKIFLRLVRNY